MFRHLLLLMTLLIAGCQTSYYQGPPSDHFDGKKFYYPGEKNRKNNPLDLASIGLAILQKPWPRQLPSIHYPNHPDYPQDTKITFINHSSVLIQTKKSNFLMDPVYSYRVSPFKFIGPARVREPGVLFEDLPSIDVVLISHNHYDHLDLATLKRLNKQFNPLFIVPLGNKKLLNAEGISKIVELDWWKSYKINGSTITLLPARHSSQRWILDHNRTLWGSYGLQVDDKKIYFAGDTGYDKHFKMIRQKWGRPDFSFLPIGAYEPRSLLKHDHMDPEEALKSHSDLQSAASLGIHWNTFQLSAERIDQPAKDLEMAIVKARDHSQFFIVREGDAFSIRKAPPSA